MKPAALFAATLLLAAGAVAQEGPYSAPAQEPPPQFFEEKPPSRFSLRWDLLARFDRVDHLDYGYSIDRGRFELRPEIDFDAFSNLRLGARALFEYGTEPYSYPYQDNFISRQAALDRGYVLWTPGNFAFRGGKFGMPLLSSEMLWDRDIQTTGAAASWTSGNGAWTFAGGAFFGPQHYGDETQIVSGQAVFRTGDPSVFQLEAAGTYWSTEPKNLIGAYLRENTGTVVDGLAVYASEFHVADLLVRLRFPLGGVPMLISLDGYQNFAALDGRKLAFEGAVVAGQVGTPGNWRAFYVYQYIQRDATIGAYNTDDWWYHTWYRGHRVGVAWTFLPQLYLQGSFSVQKILNESDWVNRYLVDLVKMF